MKMTKLISGRIPFEPPLIPEEMVWTNSCVRMYRKCKRKFFWKYMMLLIPWRLSKPLTVGKTFHSGMTRWYNSKRVSMVRVAESVVEEALENVETRAEYFDNDDLQDMFVHVRMVQGMLVGYAGLHKDDKDKWKLKAKLSEARFEIQRTGYKIAGGIDLIPYEKGKPIVVEHKTAASIPESYITRLPLDNQIRTYTIGGESLVDEKIKKVYYNVVKKCKKRRKKGQSWDDYTIEIMEDYQSRPDFYYFREPLPISQLDKNACLHEYDQTDREYHLIVNEMTDKQDPRCWTPNDGCCNEYFSTCPYLDLCNNGLNKASAHSFYQGETMHMELTEGAN